MEKLRRLRRLLRAGWTTVTVPAATDTKEVMSWCKATCEDEFQIRFRMPEGTLLALKSKSDAAMFVLRWSK